MSMHASTVRFGGDLWAEIEREAAREGVSVAQFVRDAALLRVATLAARRGDEITLATLDDLAARPSRRAPARRAAAALGDPARVAAARAAHDGLGPRERAAIDRLGELARQSLDAPVAMISLIGDELQHPLSCAGVATRPGPFGVERSICRDVVEARQPLVIGDTRADERLAALAEPPLAIVAYVGAPLITDDGHALGAIAAIDHAPRVWSDDDVTLLLSIAQSVVTELERTRDERAAA
ncbi:GAF domain-containing protein [Conexibacter woesei]|uniref:GAF domain-containing protein n=1 Tax=Conexibacter woesei TaxID=191495 RepID=UPI00041F3E03|nr:GAF domain-containing protein [Conexibacter woesei]